MLGKVKEMPRRKFLQWRYVTNLGILYDMSFFVVCAILAFFLHMIRLFGIGWNAKVEGWNGSNEEGCRTLFTPGNIHWIWEPLPVTTLHFLSSGFGRFDTSSVEPLGNISLNTVNFIALSNSFEYFVWKTHCSISLHGLVNMMNSFYGC